MDDIKGFLAPFSVSEGLPEPFFPHGPHVCLAVEFFRNLEREMENVSDSNFSCFCLLDDDDNPGLLTFFATAAVDNCSQVSTSILFIVAQSPPKSSPSLHVTLSLESMTHHSSPSRQAGRQTVRASR